MEYIIFENRVIDARELEGLEAWLIHGTWSDPSTFSQPIIDLAKQAGNGEWFANAWSGENNSPARSEAAYGLVRNIISERGGLDNPDPIVLIGHSHGGNVAIEAFNILNNKYQSAVSIDGTSATIPEMTLITINTPVRDGVQLNKPATENVAHFNVYNNFDSVQANGGSIFNGLEAGRTYDNAINIEYEDQIPATDSSGCGITNHCGTATANAEVWTETLNNYLE